MGTDLKDQVVVITGGGGAIGSAMAQRFAQAGARVVLADVNADSMRAVAADLAGEGAEVLQVMTDVSSLQSVEAMVAQTVSRFGRLDILVNNAGINGGPGDRKPIQEYDDSLWHKIIAIDLTGVYLCSKHAAKVMIDQGGGKIINISSIVGLTPLRLQCAFAAAKAGVINLTRAMALELAPHQIRVNCIAPGSILFEGTRNLFYANPRTAEAMLAHIPLGQPGEPMDIAGMACFLASGDAKYMTGSVVTIDGGWTVGYTRDF